LNPFSLTQIRAKSRLAKLEKMEPTEFDPMDYAYDNHGETIMYMNDDEIDQINECETKSEVDDYLRGFYERT